jgi:uncharacterized membrane protein
MEGPIITWLVRYGHVLGGGIWLGGYALFALALVPLMEKEQNPTLVGAATALVRLISYAGSVTILFGLILITRTRGFGAILRGGEWGGIIVTCILIAFALMGIGDSALRPALRRVAETSDYRPVRRFAWIGFALTVIAIGLMTRALYAPT